MADNSVKAEKENKPSFWQGVKAEWHKIIWPDKKTLVRQVVIVVVISVILGIIIAVADGVFMKLMELIMS